MLACDACHASRMLNRTTGTVATGGFVSSFVSRSGRLRDVSFDADHVRAERLRLAKVPIVGAASKGKMRKLHVAAESVATSKSASAGTSSSSAASITYLEGNSWLWELSGVKVLLDPVLVGPLDFGIPAFYQGFKRFHRSFTLDQLPQIDVLLLTQGLDDHCHKNTLAPLSELLPDLPVFAALSAQPVLSSLKFTKVTYLEPGMTATVTAANGTELRIEATPGPVLGPPWQRPENGYIVRSASPQCSIYYEPHCVFGPGLDKYAPVDIVVTPVVKQVLPAFTLVSGQEDAVELIRQLQPRHVVVSSPGELDANGFLNVLVSEQGTLESFKALLAAAKPQLARGEPEIVVPEPGKAVGVPV